MATAQIQINSTPGSNTDLPLNTFVSLSNNDNTGVTTWQWTILSQPAGTPVVLATPTASTAAFTPTKEGSYLIRLVVNTGLAGEATDQVVASVLELETRSRIPAAGETIEVDSNNGWSNAAVSEILQRVTRFTDNGILVGKAGEPLTPLQVVHISDATEIGVLPAQQRTVPSFEVAYANNMNHLYGTLGVYLETVAGAANASLGDLVRVMSLGPISGVTLAAGGLDGDPVYVDDTGALSLTPGTNSRQIGTIAHAMGGTTYDLWISGLGGASGAPVGPAGGVLGYPSSTYPNPSGLAADSANEIKLAPYGGFTNVNFAADGSTSANGTTIQLTAGNTTFASGIGGGVELFAGASSAGDGGTVQIYSGDGLTAGELNLFVGTSANTVGASAIFRAGRSQTLAGGALYLEGGTSQSSTAGTAGGAVNITGGFNTNSNTLGGDVVITGGTGALAPGGKLLLGGGIGTIASLSAGSATLQGQNGATAGMSGGSVALLAGNGGNAGQAGAISITAGNSTQNSAGADGGAVTITAGNNTTLNGQGGNIVLTAGTGTSSSAGGVITMYGGNSDVNKKSNIELIAGGSAAVGQHVKLAGGSSVGANGNVYIGGGAGAGTSGQVYIGYSGVTNGPAASDVFIGSTGKENTIKGDTTLGETTSVNVIRGATTIGGTSQVTTVKGSVVIGDNGTVTTRLVLSPSTYSFATSGTITGETIPVSSPNIRVIPAIGAVNQQSVPSIETVGVPEGTRVVIVNGHAATVTFNSDPHVAGTKLKLGANSRVIPQYGVLELQYMKDSSNALYWTEVGFRG